MSGFEWPPLPEWFWYPVTFVYGAIVGSFLNVVIYRLPLGKHLSKPPSTCPNCNYILTFWDNIPLLSFLGLGARCRLCRQPISWRYFCVELVTACLWSLLYHQVANDTGISWFSYVIQALFLSVLIALVFIDLDHFIAPDELTIVAGVLGIGHDLACLALAFATGGAVWETFRGQFTYFGWLPVGVVGALTYGGLLFLVSLLGFIYYAREPKESIASVTKRFFDFSWEEETVASPEESAEAAEPVADAEPEEEEEGDPPRIAFSPAFLCVVSAAAMAPLVKLWAIGFFVVPLLAFLLIAHRKDEPYAATFGRFFRSDDLGLPASASAEVAQAQAEADQFVKEAESGQWGGMGLGDAKLAIGIGGLLGPGLALLSLGFATLVGAVTGITVAKMHGKSLRLGLPFVPFMAAGCIIVMLYGRGIVAWYGRILNPETPPPPTPAMILRDLKAKEREARRLRGVAAPRLRPATGSSPATPPDPTQRAPGSR